MLPNLKSWGDHRKRTCFRRNQKTLKIDWHAPPLGFKASVQPSVQRFTVISGMLKQAPFTAKCRIASLGFRSLSSPEVPLIQSMKPTINKCRDAADYFALRGRHSRYLGFLNRTHTTLSSTENTSGQIPRRELQLEPGGGRKRSVKSYFKIPGKYSRELRLWKNTHVLP